MMKFINGVLIPIKFAVGREIVMAAIVMTIVKVEILNVLHQMDSLRTPKIALNTGNVTTILPSVTCVTQVSQEGTVKMEFVYSYTARCLGSQSAVILPCCVVYCISSSQ